MKPYLKASSSVIVPSNILGVDAGVNASKDDSTVWQASSTLRPRVGGFIMYLTDGKGMSGNCNRLTGKGSSLKFLIFDNSCGVLCWVSNFLSLSTSGSSVCHEMRNEVMRWKNLSGMHNFGFYFTRLRTIHCLRRVSGKPGSIFDGDLFLAWRIIVVSPIGLKGENKLVLKRRKKILKAQQIFSL